MKKLIIFSLFILIMPFIVYGAETVSNELSLGENAKSAILIEQSTGQILFEKNSH